MSDTSSSDLDEVMGKLDAVVKRTAADLASIQDKIETRISETNPRIQRQVTRRMAKRQALLTVAFSGSMGGRLDLILVTLADTVSRLEKEVEELRELANG